MTIRRSILLLAFLLTACNLPLAPFRATATPGGPSVTPTMDLTRTPLGTSTNPIVVALPPSASSAAQESAQAMIAQLSEMSALSFVTVTPSSYTELVAELGAGRVHVAWLPPFPYLLAVQKGYADAPMAATIEGRDRVASEFLVNARLLGLTGFKTYYNPASGENITDAASALAQFKNKIPCWTDAYSAEGYVVPLGLLKENHVRTRPGAFLQGDLTVVKSLHLDPEGGICQFGATYADARSLLAVDQPDVKDRVVIVWMTDPIVPYDAVVYASGLDADMRTRLTAALMTMAQTEQGSASMFGAYGCDGLKFADDSAYDELRHYLQLSGLNLSALVR
jgi:phosphonate transport system substrate-binding protein